jgi:TRAP-type C4-dicarboxylate transport system permease large subunit
MATVHVYAKIYNYPVYPRATLREFFCSAAQSVPGLMTPFIIVGGILLGWFTATESACVAVIYAAVLSIFVYREMDAKQLYHALAETGRLSAVALFCVGTASAFGWMLAYARSWPTSPRGAWASRKSVSSSPPCFWWSAASSMRFRRSSSSARRSNRSPDR